MTTKISGDNIKIAESSAAPADEAGRGQLWMKNDSPNTLQFTDDGGTDIPISQGTAKVWYQYLQAGPTVSDSLNVTSITDDSTGNYTVNITNVMNSSDFGRVGMSADNYTLVHAGSRSASADPYITDHNTSGTANDVASFGAFIGDLA